MELQEENTLTPAAHLPGCYNLNNEALFVCYGVKNKKVDKLVNLC